MNQLGAFRATIALLNEAEGETALDLAERVLDRPNVDPDDDCAILARQLLRYHALLQGAIGSAWNFDMETAPKPGPILLLIGKEGPDLICQGALEDARPWRTIGQWTTHPRGGGLGWVYPGWDWCDDKFIVGSGKPIAWAPLSAPTK